jgi:hypothetical protein
MVIWTYHVCREGQYEEALWFLEKRQQEKPGLSVPHLLQAYAYGKLRQFTKKKNHLSEFKRLCHGNEALMRAKLDEFSNVFGQKEAQALATRLRIARA